jgi:hypothetical protein
MEKIRYLQEVNDEMTYLKEEDKIIGKYIQSLDFDDPLEITSPKSVEGMQMFVDQIKTKNKNRDKVLKTLQDFIKTFDNGIKDQLGALVVKIQILKGFFHEDV